MKSVRDGTADLAVNELDRADRLQAEGRFPKTIGMCNDFEALAVLVEEVGEVAHEVNETIGRAIDLAYQKRLQTELIQVAAMAIGWAERIRRDTCFRSDS